VDLFDPIIWPETFQTTIGRIDKNSDSEKEYDCNGTPKTNGSSIAFSTQYAPIYILHNQRTLFLAGLYAASEMINRTGKVCLTTDHFKQNLIETLEKTEGVDWDNNIIAFAFFKCKQVQHKLSTPSWNPRKWSVEEEFSQLLIHKIDLFDPIIWPETFQTTIGRIDKNSDSEKEYDCNGTPTTNGSSIAFSTQYAPIYIKESQRRCSTT
jgi:NADH:ubiquinone oxidoreductase subunit 3 (subunit A)